MNYKYCLTIAAILFNLSSYSQSKDEKEILAILENQTINWNEGKLDQFMVGYWKNDSLLFIGKSGVTYGYENTLNNYRKNYGDASKMGKLSFQILKVQRIAADYFFVVGKWFLKRTIGDLEGHYTLMFRKIQGQWVIVSDHSS